MEKGLKLLLAGVIAGIILFVAAGISYRYTGEIVDPSLRALFRETVSMKWFHKLLLLNAGMGLMMTVFYALLQNGIPGQGMAKGIMWGFIIWFIIVTQPLIFQLVNGQFSSERLLTWLMQGLASYVAAGLSISLIYKPGK